MSYLASPHNKPLQLFKDRNTETLFHQRRISKEAELNLQSRASALGQGYGALVPINKNLYYSMKARLENVVKTSQDGSGTQRSQSTNLFKDLLKESHTSHEQSFNKTQQAFLKAPPAEEGNTQRQMISYEPLYPAGNNRRLFRNGIKLTLGNKPVKFSKKVYLFNQTPSCSISKINLQFSANDTEQIKLMPSRRKVSPIQQSQQKLITIDSNNENFDQKAHNTYFNDFFGFTDKGKLQLNEELPVTERFKRDFNIINNQPVRAFMKYQGKKVHSELKTQYNSPCRYYVANKQRDDPDFMKTHIFGRDESKQDFSRQYRSTTSLMGDNSYQRTRYQSQPPREEGKV